MIGKNTKELSFYCSADEKEQIEKLAKENNMSVSEYVRLKALNQEKIQIKTVLNDRKFDIEKAKLGTLNRIGNNINQIAHAFNLFNKINKTENNYELNLMLKNYHSLLSKIIDEFKRIKGERQDDENVKR